MTEFTLFPLFQSGMVIQRQKPIHIWGNAPAGSDVTVTLKASSVTVCTDADEEFHAYLPAMEADTGCTLTVCCHIPVKQQPANHPESSVSGNAAVISDKIVLNDISIGDIWLACGQSNMEFFLRYDRDWEAVKHYENNPQIRVYNVPQTAFHGHATRNATGYGHWMQSNDKDFETFSAPGYSFARNLQPHINVPIGIIGCNWGGTTATAWMDESNLIKKPLNVYLKEYEEACSLYPEEEMKRISLKAWEFEDSSEHDLEFRPLLYGRDYEWQKQYMVNHKNDPVIPMGPYNINRPGGLYHMMLEPLHNFAIKGVIWYQGESDAGHADMYDTLLETMITAWRKKWNDEFPFLFVQLAPFGVWLECTSDNYAIVREKQEIVSNTVPNTGMISIMDIGSYYDIHPKEKMEVGRRLALLARGKVYGEDILCESPRLVSANRKDNVITLTFNHCNTLSIGEGKNDFVIMQNDSELSISEVTTTENMLNLTIDTLTNDEVTVSLGYADYAEIHIFNKANLPVCPFKIII